MSRLNQNPFGRLIRQVQDQLEKRAGTFTDDESVLQQDPFWLKSVTWTLIGTTMLCIGWLAIARTEEVVVAVGKLEPVGDVKEIRIPTGGVVEEILIKSGDRVKKGQLLIRLDQESTAEQIVSLEKSVTEKGAQIVQKQEQRKLKLLERERTLDFNRAQLATTQSNLTLESQILERLAGLAVEGALPEIEYLRQRTRVAQLQGEFTKEELDGHRQIALIDQQVEQLNAELAGLRSERSQLKARLTEVKVTNRYQLLRSPVDGTVFDLKLTNPGFVSQDQSSQAALKVVPFNALEADVEIPSRKIGFVRIGQVAEVSIDSFPATDFGVLEGTVSSVGSDALAPDVQKGRDQYIYPATIKLNEQELKLHDGTVLSLQVGMSLTANIKLRSVSYLQLLLNTFRSKVDSLRQI